MRKLNILNHGRIDDSKPEMGLSLICGKYNTERLTTGNVKEYNMYVAFSNASLYIVDSEKKEVVFKNSWKYETYTTQDCVWGDNFKIHTKLILDSKEIKVISYTYDDFVNMLFGVSENCRTIEYAKRYLEECGLHQSSDCPELYLSTPVYPDFVHLNVHSHYSILQSQITIPAAVRKAVADDMKGMALTDVGVMYGIKEFVDYCANVNKARAKEGLEPFKPIIGCEMYIAPRSMYDKEKGDEKCGRLIVLAKNFTGYKNLCKLVSNSWTDGLMNQTPRTDHAELEKYKDGLIIIASGINSEIANYAIAGNMDKALTVGEWYKAIFGDDFYIGIQGNNDCNNSDEDDVEGVLVTKRVANAAYLNLDIKCDVKSVCVNCCNYLDREDRSTLDTMFAIANNTTLNDKPRLRHVKDEWMKTREELTPLFRGRTDVIINTNELFDKIEFYSIDNVNFPFL